MSSSGGSSVIPSDFLCVKYPWTQKNYLSGVGVALGQHIPQKVRPKSHFELLFQILLSPLKLPSSLGLNEEYEF